MLIKIWISAPLTCNNKVKTRNCVLKSSLFRSDFLTRISEHSGCTKQTVFIEGLSGLSCAMSPVEYTGDQVAKMIQCVNKTDLELWHCLEGVVCDVFMIRASLFPPVSHLARLVLTYYRWQ